MILIPLLLDLISPVQFFPLPLSPSLSLYYFVLNFWSHNFSWHWLPSLAFSLSPTIFHLVLCTSCSRSLFPMLSSSSLLFLFHLFSIFVSHIMSRGPHSCLVARFVLYNAQVLFFPCTLLLTITLPHLFLFLSLLLVFIPNSLSLSLSLAHNF